MMFIKDFVFKISLKIDFFLSLKMVIKTCWLFLSLICLVANKVHSLKEDEYVSTVAQLMLNPIFLEEYQKWTEKLFSNPDYLNGPKPGVFPCKLNLNETRNDPLTAHNLRPQDIQCIAAIGDSITAGLGAQAKTPIGLVTEWRGSFAFSFSFSYILNYIFLKEFHGQLVEIFLMMIY